MKIVSLCSDCKKCPQVIVREEKVEIGEEGNLCVLNLDEWAELRKSVLEGRI